jgi:hypothetical protein
LTVRARDEPTRHDDRVSDSPPLPAPQSEPLPADPTAAGSAEADPFLDAIQPHPGRSVPWPPAGDQRGLAAPYPPGGLDPQPDVGLTEERHYLRLLIAMIVLIVGGGFAIGIIGALLGFSGGPG